MILSKKHTAHPLPNCILCYYPFKSCETILQPTSNHHTLQLFKIYHIISSKNHKPSRRKIKPKKENQNSYIRKLDLCVPDPFPLLHVCFLLFCRGNAFLLRVWKLPRAVCRVGYMNLRMVPTIPRIKPIIQPPLAATLITENITATALPRLRKSSFGTRVRAPPISTKMPQVIPQYDNGI